MHLQQTKRKAESLRVGLAGGFHSGCSEVSIFSLRVIGIDLAMIFMETEQDRTHNY